LASAETRRSPFTAGLVPFYLLDDCNHLQLDRNGRRESSDFNSGSRGVGLAWAGEPLGVHAVVRGEVGLHVGQVAGDVDDPIPRGAGILEDRPDVLEAGAALDLDVIRRDFAIRTERDSGNHFRSALPRPDTREEEEIADALGMRIRADRLRRTRRVDGSHGSREQGAAEGCTVGCVRGVVGDLVCRRFCRR